MLSPFLKKLIFARQFIMDQGKIDVLGEKQIMLSADALMEMQNIDKTEIYSIIKDATLKDLTKFAEHAKVYSALKNVIFTDISKFGRKLGSGSEGMLKNIEDIFEMYGLGDLQIISLDNKNKLAIARVKESPIAKSYVKAHNLSKGPVCTITAAVLAGMFSFLFEKELECVESKCIAKGNSFCEFIIK